MSDKFWVLLLVAFSGLLFPIWVSLRAEIQRSKFPWTVLFAGGLIVSYFIVAGFAICDFLAACGMLFCTHCFIAVLYFIIAAVLINDGNLKNSSSLACVAKISIGTLTVIFLIAGLWMFLRSETPQERANRISEEAREALMKTKYGQYEKNRVRH